MSTTPQHGAHTYIIAKLASASEEIAIGLAVVAMLNDLIPIPQRLREKNWAGLYEYLHAWHAWLAFVPPMFLHFILDKATHDEKEGGWTTAGYVLEVELWMLCILYGVMRWII